jgi:tetratricopeptide (TPR) repeat protein
MKRSRFSRLALAGLSIGLFLTLARQSGAQGGPAEAFTSPSLQPLAKTPELEEPFKAFRSGDAGATLQALRAAVKTNPDLPPPEVILAAWLAEVNQPAMARSFLEQAVLQWPDDPEAYLILANLAARERQGTEASLLLAKAYEVLTGAKITAKRTAILKPRILAGLASMADARRDWKEAQKFLEALVAENPKNGAAWEQLGRVLFHLKKPEEALAKLQEAAKLDPSVLVPEATLAQLYQQSGDVENAQKWMVAAINARLKDPRVRRAAAQWSLEVGRFKDAEEQAKAAVQLDPESAASQTVRGMVAMVRKDYKTAEEALGKAHLLAPGNFAAISDLALALAEQQSPAKKRLALEYAQVLVRLFPDQPDAAATLGWTLYRLGSLDEAEAQLRKAMSAGNPSPETYYFYARVLADRGRKDDAKKLLDAAVRMPPKGPFLWRADAEALAKELSK